MPNDVGRAWDDLVRRHWKGLWGTGRSADEARNALRSFFAAVHEDLGRHRRAIDELRGETRRGREVAIERGPIPPPKPAAAPPKPAVATPKPALELAALDPKAREKVERILGHRFHNPRLLEEALAHPSFTHENPEIGLPSNYRMAFLGDALLGFVIADALHERFPEADQQALTEMRKRIVSRPALGRAGERLGIGAHLLLGRGQEKEGRKNRTILAETLEALVAAVYLDGGSEAAKAFVLRMFDDDLRLPRAPPRPREPRRRPSRRR